MADFSIQVMRPYGTTQGYVLDTLANAYNAAAEISQFLTMVRRIDGQGFIAFRAPGVVRHVVLLTNSLNQNILATDGFALTDGTNTFTALGAFTANGVNYAICTRTGDTPGTKIYLCVITDAGVVSSFQSITGVFGSIPGEVRGYTAYDAANDQILIGRGTSDGISDAGSAYAFSRLPFAFIGVLNYTVAAPGSVSTFLPLNFFSTYAKLYAIVYNSGPLPRFVETANPLTLATVDHTNATTGPCVGGVKGSGTLSNAALLLSGQDPNLIASGTTQQVYEYDYNANVFNAVTDGGTFGSPGLRQSRAYYADGAQDTYIVMAFRIFKLTLPAGSTGGGNGNTPTPPTPPPTPADPWTRTIPGVDAAWDGSCRPEASDWQETCAPPVVDWQRRCGP